MRRFSALFGENAELKALSGQAASLAILQQRWSAAVPEALRPFTRAGNIKNQCLTVYADNGAVAAKTRLLLPSLLMQLQKQGLEITAIRVEVQVKSVPRKPGKPLRRLSPQAAARLSALARELKGSDLAQVLQRLSRRS